MTSLNPRKMIRSENYCPRKTASYRSVQSAGPSQYSNKNSCQPNPDYNYWAEPNLEDQLQKFENIARHQYLKILNTLAFEKLPGWLDRMLDQSVLPVLHRIGFVEPISKMLFEIAPSAWKLMGPVNDTLMAFHPAIHQHVEDVRQGLELEADKNDDRFPRYAGVPTATNSGTIQKNISPEGLFSLLDEIGTPWIILPRAFRFLQKQECRYLPVYLKTIDKETQEFCLKLFSRITVEFVGNFALKFADRRYQPDKLAKLLFYGYSTLFWRTLRCPPPNMENSAVFDNFFNWIRRLVRKSDLLGKERQSIDCMLKIKTTIFPTGNFHRPENPDQSDISRFIVTLRHGCIGMASILKYFGIDQFLESRRSGDRLLCPPIRKDLHRFLDAIQSNYHLESKQTRGYIRQFLGHLRSAYALIQPDLHRTEWEFLNRMFNNIQISFNR